ncbi:L-threonylcarbamoyladenylate synthase [Hydrogenivirga caldilitoris]|uniref:L-threonylcarbamoyladenylate synthase n=1 Tax=Hydrogenivirga caldilitoris TaxID=246264 RepID=A0A497XSV4_9AQUI|nr:L-threonylcarbamoyladenylate synthase [Hydrogenivirga caldilitoris]RLJ71250.1 L-threonylcarbamoyladenylate synthase [Hydrogenivirga caldilitoris]
MRRVSSKSPEAVRLASEVLSEGEFVVAPTDTIYGILADALNYEAVQRLKRLRRPSGRPFLVLVPDVFWVRKLGLEADRRTMKLLAVPGLTLVLKKRKNLYHWLGGQTVAVRCPRRGFIVDLLRDFGRPVVAPSANLEGKPPASTIEEAIKYFGDSVSLYVDGCKIEGKPSTILKLTGGDIKVIRSGRLSSSCLKRLLRGAKL